MTRALLTLAWAAGLAMPAALLARAAAEGAPPPPSDAVAANRDVMLKPRVGEFVPLDLEFRDDKDRPVTLRQCIAGKPTILVPMYYRCPKVCGVVLEELVQTLRKMPADYTAGGKFNVVCVSFDAKERNSRTGDNKTLAEEKKANTLAVYGRPGAEDGWHFLTGEKEAIKECMAAIGYEYEYDRVFKEYKHPSGLIVLTPEGKIARYFYGLNFDAPQQLAGGGAVDEKYLLPGELIPKGMTTLRLSLVEASDGKIGSLADQITLLCSSFEYGKGYNVKLAIQVGGLLTLLCVGTWVGLNLRRERRRAAAVAAAAAQDQGHGAPASGGAT
jgi:protein SCO1/2